MATTAELSENSHQGFDGIKAALCLASMEAKSNTASEMRACLRQDRIGSRSSGKERDETGLDYFGARYLNMKQSIKLLDVVALTADMPDRKLRRGQVGTIVEQLDPGVFEVEFTDNDGRVFASLALKTNQLMVLHYQPLEAA